MTVAFVGTVVSSSAFSEPMAQGTVPIEPFSCGVPVQGLRLELASIDTLAGPSVPSSVTVSLGSAVVENWGTSPAEVGNLRNMRVGGVFAYDADLEVYSPIDRVLFEVDPDGVVYFQEGGECPLVRPFDGEGLTLGQLRDRLQQQTWPDTDQGTVPAPWTMAGCRSDSGGIDTE